MVHAAAGLFRKQHAEVNFAGSVLALSGPAEQVNLFGRQLAGGASVDVEHERSIGHAANLFDVVAFSGKHLAQLTVAAFDEDNFVPGILSGADQSDARRGGFHFALAWTVFWNGHTAAETLDGLFRRLAGNLDQVRFFYARVGAGELVRERPVIGDKQKPFALEIEATDGVEALAQARKELHHRGAAFGVADRGDESTRLVEQKVA
jgi:hypothetical protein